MLRENNDTKYHFEIQMKTKPFFSRRYLRVLTNGKNEEKIQYSNVNYYNYEQDTFLRVITKVNKSKYFKQVLKVIKTNYFIRVLKNSDEHDEIFVIRNIEKK